jgi:hypothetical protein
MSIPVYQLLKPYIHTMPLFDPHTHPAAVILLAFVLAAGFLLVILSCALWNNWLPLLVGTSSLFETSLPVFELLDYEDRRAGPTKEGEDEDRRVRADDSPNIRHGTST